MILKITSVSARSQTFSKNISKKPLTEAFTLPQMLSRRAFTLALALLSLPSFAKPQRMRIVVPYPAGGPLDAAARMVAEGLKTHHGRVIVDNRAGAAGARGMLEVKNAAADDQTLVIGALATLVVNPLLFDDLPYKPDDFSPVALLSDAPNVLVMTQKSMDRLGIKNASDLMQYIAKHPGELNCASGGTGSAGHILNALLDTKGLHSVHVPYAGAMAAQLSLYAGETDFMFDNFGNARGPIADGRLNVLAQTAAQPLAEINAPTLSSIGIEADISTWFGLMAPKDTAMSVREALFEEISQILSEAKKQKQFEAACGKVKLLSPQAFSQWIETEQVKYRSFVQSLKI